MSFTPTYTDVFPLATVETITHHANDDYDRMIAHDAAAEELFLGLERVASQLLALDDLGVIAAHGLDHG